MKTESQLKIDERDKTILETKDEIIKIRNELSESTIRAEDIHKKYIESNKKLIKIQQDYESIIDEVDILNEQIRAKNIIIKDYDEKILVFQHDKDNNTTKIMELESDLYILKQKNSEILEAYNLEIEEYAINVKIYERDIKDLEKSNKILKEEEDKLKNELEISSNDKNIFKSKYSSVKNKIFNKTEGIEVSLPNKVLVERRQNYPKLIGLDVNERSHIRVKDKRENKQIEISQTKRDE